MKCNSKKHLPILTGSLMPKQGYLFSWSYYWVIHRPMRIRLLFQKQCIGLFCRCDRLPVNAGSAR